MYYVFTLYSFCVKMLYMNTDEKFAFLEQLVKEINKLDSQEALDENNKQEANNE